MNPSLDHLDAVDPATAPADRETVIPVFEEEISVAKRVVETARVKVSRVTHQHQQLVDEMLQLEKVEVERVPIDRPIESMPSIRQEGDVTIVPVVEEILKVERRLVLPQLRHQGGGQHPARLGVGVIVRAADLAAVSVVVGPVLDRRRLGRDQVGQRQCRWSRRPNSRSVPQSSGWRR